MTHLLQILILFSERNAQLAYYFATGFDFGAKYSPLFKRILDSTGTYRTNTFDDRLDLIDTWSDFDGDIADDVNVEVYLRAGVDDSAKIAGIDFDAEDMVQAEDEHCCCLKQEHNTIQYGPWVPLENTSLLAVIFSLKLCSRLIMLIKRQS